MKLTKVLGIRDKDNPFLDKKWTIRETCPDENTTIITMIHQNGIHLPMIFIFMKKPWRVFVSGDYGCWTWDNLTWEPNIHNMPYENTSYISEKLSQESRKALYEFDEHKAERDIKEWVKYLFSYYGAFGDNKFSTQLWEALTERYDDDLLKTWCEKRDISFKWCDKDEMADHLVLIKELLNNCSDEVEFKSFLHEHYNEFNDLESDFFESSLLDAGRCYSPYYLYTLLAMQTASKRLKQKEKRGKKND